MELKPGDKVRLRSGGPVMTIRCWLGDGDPALPMFRAAGWECVWFTQGVAKSEIFTREMLEPAPDP